MKIDELSTGHFFDMEFLRAYRLKLQILERHELFEEERGFGFEWRRPEYLAQAWVGDLQETTISS